MHVERDPNRPGTPSDQYGHDLKRAIIERKLFGPCQGRPGDHGAHEGCGGWFESKALHNGGVKQTRLEICVCPCHYADGTLVLTPKM